MPTPAHTSTDDHDDGRRARGDPRAGVVMSSGAGTVLVPRLLDRTRDTARIALVPGGAMVLGGDHLSVRVEVGGVST